MKRLGAARIVIQIRSSLCSCRRVDFLEASRNYAGIAEGVASLVGASENLITLDHTNLHKRTSDGSKIVELFALMEQV